MKILVIAMNVGRIAPGIVTERLIKGLSGYHELDILTRDYDPSINLDRVNKVFEFNYKDINPYLSKLFMSLFSVNPADILFAKKTISKINIKYDLILSFISSNHYISLIMGNDLASKLKIPHCAHFVDAIPAPGGWLPDNHFYKGVQRFMYKYLSNIDALFASNQKMLAYQLTTFKPKKKIITGVVYNPGNDKMEYYNNSKNEKNTFLFTGGLYGPRKPIYILAAFKKILKEYPDSTLEFVGSNLPENYLSIFNSREQEKIIVHPFAKDLTAYYERATALIDIDADLPNDVFLSSKIINYITISRLIITETGNNSPSREIFNGIPSILQCGHDVDQLYIAMKKAIQQKGKIDFNDRAGVISLFDLNSVTQKLNEKLQMLPVHQSVLE